jgi:hypothetical protein
MVSVISSASGFGTHGLLASTFHGRLASTVGTECAVGTVGTVGADGQTVGV